MSRTDLLRIIFGTGVGLILVLLAGHWIYDLAQKCRANRNNVS